MQPSSPTSPDSRVTQAAEYLSGARRRKVTELPPSVLMRELAEARRQVGQLLDAYRELAEPVPCTHRCMQGRDCGGCGCSGCGFTVWRQVDA